MNSNDILFIVASFMSILYFFALITNRGLKKENDHYKEIAHRNVNLREQLLKDHFALLAEHSKCEANKEEPGIRSPSDKPPEDEERIDHIINRED